MTTQTSVLQAKCKKLKLVYKYDCFSSNRLYFIKKDLKNQRYSYKHILLVFNNIYHIAKNHVSNGRFYQKIKSTMERDLMELRRFVQKQRRVTNNPKLYIEP